MIKKSIFKSGVVILISFILLFAISSVSADDGDLNSTPENNESIENFNLTANDIELYYKNGTQYSVKLTDENGTALGNKPIVISVNGVNYTKNTSDEGIAYLGIELRPGTYTITSTYGNNTITNTATILSTLSGESIVKYFRNDTQFYVKLVDGQGNPLSNAVVYMNINGVFYPRTTNEEGIATLEINLNPKFYILTAEDPITNLLWSFNITVLSTLFGNDLVKYYKNGSQYDIEVLDNDGSPLTSTNVTFNINGVFYTRTTNNEGIATLEINLYPGKYIITAQHPNGLMFSNDITVLPTIFVDDLKYDESNPQPFVVTILDGEGNLKDNASVTINSGQSSLTKKTVNGTVEFFFRNALPGEYTITFEYDDYFISRMLTVYRLIDGGFERTNLGANSNGSAYKVTKIGNQSSNVTIAYIIGVHPSEYRVHNALYELLLNMSSSLKYNYEIYKITVYGDSGSDDIDRMKGQLIGQQYVVPEILNNRYDFVIDVHSNGGTAEGNYLETNFAFAPYQDSISKQYATKIINDLDLVQYFPASQTSPPYVTIPIAKSGIPTIIYETYKLEPYYTTKALVSELILSVESFDFTA